MKNERQLSFSDFRWAEKGTNTNNRINMYYFSNTLSLFGNMIGNPECVQFSSSRFAALKAFCDSSMQKMLCSLCVSCQESSSSSSSSLREARLHFLKSEKLRNVEITNGMERERESRFLETGKFSRAELEGRNTNGKWNGTHIRIK